jgi:hypothetical protein
MRVYYKKKGVRTMSSREYVKSQIDALPDAVVEKIQEFIAFQRYTLGIFENDTEYLSAIPGMVESIKAAAAEPLEDCVPLSVVWSDI